MGFVRQVCRVCLNSHESNVHEKVLSLLLNQKGCFEVLVCESAYMFIRPLVLADSDASELDRQRRLLCIRKQDVKQVHRDTCGRIFATVNPSLAYPKHLLICLQRPAAPLPGPFLSYPTFKTAIASCHSEK